MKLLVFSDSHGDTTGIYKALSAHPDADCAVHLGDGVRDFESVICDFPHLLHCSVEGNYEQYFSYREENPRSGEVVIDFDGVKFMLTHGHLYGVKSTLEHACAKALEKGADVLLFGHTHQSLDRIFSPGGDEKKLRVFNPGSCGRGSERSYGVITIINGVVVMGHGNVQ